MLASLPPTDDSATVSQLRRALRALRESQELPSWGISPPEDWPRARVPCNVRYMGERKKELLLASVQYVKENGVAELSLRPLAEAIGTSARLLIFHFRTKEGLLHEIIETLRERLQRSLAAQVAARIEPVQGVPLQALWRWATRPQNLCGLRVLYEARMIALKNPHLFGQRLPPAPVDWSGALAARLPARLRNRGTATLCAAMIDGLLMDLLASGDFGRTTRALQAFERLLCQGVEREVHSIACSMDNFDAPAGLRRKQRTRAKQRREALRGAAASSGLAKN